MPKDAVQGTTDDLHALAARGRLLNESSCPESLLRKWEMLHGLQAALCILALQLAALCRAFLGNWKIQSMNLSDHRFMKVTTAITFTFHQLSCRICTLKTPVT